MRSKTFYVTESQSRTTERYVGKLVQIHSYNLFYILFDFITFFFNNYINLYYARLILNHHVLSTSVKLQYTFLVCCSNSSVNSMFPKRISKSVTNNYVLQRRLQIRCCLVSLFKEQIFLTFPLVTCQCLVPLATVSGREESLR